MNIIWNIKMKFCMDDKEVKDDKDDNDVDNDYDDNNYEYNDIYIYIFQR